MSILPATPADAAADTAPDPPVLRAERRLRLLAELAEIGMELARALKPSPPTSEAEASGPAAVADEAKGSRRDPAEVFAGLSRAIRLTLTLEATADQQLRDLVAGVVREREETRARTAARAREADARRRELRGALVSDLVYEAATEQLTDDADHERLHQELIDRFDEEDDTWSDPDRPLREVVEEICEHFALTPDWSRWRDDDWAPRAPPVWPWIGRSAAPRSPPPAAPRDPALAGAHALE